MPKYMLSAHPSIPTTLSLWSSLLTPAARAAVLRGNRGHRLNCHEDAHSLKQCRHAFINASDCLNPDLGQPGDDGEAYRR